MVVKIVFIVVPLALHAQAVDLKLERHLLGVAGKHHHDGIHTTQRVQMFIGPFGVNLQEQGKARKKETICFALTRYLVRSLTTRFENKYQRGLDVPLAGVF